MTKIPVPCLYTYGREVQYITGTRCLTATKVKFRNHTTLHSQKKQDQFTVLLMCVIFVHLFL